MRRNLSFLAAAIAAVMILAPAFALAKPHAGKAHGKAHTRSSTTVTEDNDGDGTANNVADAGDNRHPSGKDRSVENGSSENQGSSLSDPDADSNGGMDKPGHSGGIDEADQDGNNGCGNDDDFEDDNNGNCLAKGQSKVQSERTDTEEEASGQGSGPEAEGTGSSGNDTGSGAAVEGTTESDTEATATVPSVLGTRQSQGTGTSVLGSRVAKAPSGAVAASRVRGASLPFTGSNVIAFVFLALGLIASGTAVVRLRRI